jgi:hypothetical protein
MAEISLPVFEGPLDLLLHLIERDDLDITAVSLVAVTDQYLTALRSGEKFDPQALAEFVAVGAKLIYLKSRALLPRPPQEDDGLEDDDVGRERSAWTPPPSAPWRRSRSIPSVRARPCSCASASATCPPATTGSWRSA